MSWFWLENTSPHWVEPTKSVGGNGHETWTFLHPGGTSGWSGAAMNSVNQAFDQGVMMKKALIDPEKVLSTDQQTNIADYTYVARRFLCLPRCHHWCRCRLTSENCLHFIGHQHLRHKLQDQFLRLLCRQFWCKVHLLCDIICIQGVSSQLQHKQAWF